jgi:hypothetical protein
MFRPDKPDKHISKVLEKVLINRIMHYMRSHNLLNLNQYGFTPQTSTVDVVMDLKDYVQRGMEEGQYVALISLDVKGALDAAWWPGILFSLRTKMSKKPVQSM